MTYDDPAARLELLALLNSAAVWLLQQRRHGVVWAAQPGQPQAAPLVTASALCCVATSSLSMMHREGTTTKELLLAAEAAGLAAAVQLAAREPAAACGGSGLAAGDASLTHVELELHRCLFRLYTEGWLPDLSSVTGSVESLLGSAEALLRHAVAASQPGVCQQQQQEQQAAGAAARAPAVAGVGQATAPLLDPVSAQSMAAVEAAAGLIQWAARQPTDRRTAWTAGARAAVEACALTLAKLARQVAVLPGKCMRTLMPS